MKILQVHNYYQQAGGEDSVVYNEKSLLEKAGHKVQQFTAHNEVIKSFKDKISTAKNTTYSKNKKQELYRYIIKNEPDVVHVHNFFPLLTPSIFDACVETATPSVLTLHNYRLICPGGLLMRNGIPCEICVGSTPYRSVLYGCYQQSRLATIPVANMVRFHRMHGTWCKNVNAFIALTKMAKQKFIQGGFPADKIHIKPNFIKDIQLDSVILNANARSGAVYIGRLTEEKGIRTLIESWHTINYPLTIIGDGPLRDHIQNSTNQYIKYLGQLGQDEVHAQMRKASFLVMPSEWYEGFPMVLAEAFAHALPVVASNMGAMKEIVDHGVNGLHFEPGNPLELRKCLIQLISDLDARSRMANMAREKYLKYYNPEANLNYLYQIYEEAMNDMQRNKV